ncbi:MAG: DUF5807 family protein [Haloferacaceae archaeon]
MDVDHARDQFLAGERPDEVVLYLADEATDAAALVDHGLETDDGVLLVLPGEQGREAFAAGTGTDAMTFAGQAMGAEGTVATTLDGGTCPDDDGEDDHVLRFLLAFAEEQNEDVGGQYAEGGVVHAYAQCSCGTAYSDRWTVGDRA